MDGGDLSDPAGLAAVAIERSIASSAVIGSESIRRLPHHGRDDPGRAGS